MVAGIRVIYASGKPSSKISWSSESRSEFGYQLRTSNPALEILRFAVVLIRHIHDRIHDRHYTRILLRIYIASYRRVLKGEGGAYQASS